MDMPNRIVPKPRINLSGHRYGKLLVVKPYEYRSKTVFYWCQCDCGVEKSIRACNLQSGRSTTCGCGKKPPPSGFKHGLSRTKEYRLAATKKWQASYPEKAAQITRDYKQKMQRENPEHLRKLRRKSYWKVVAPNKNRPLPPRPMVNCKHCGKLFKTKHDAHIFCCRACSDAGKSMPEGWGRITIRVCQNCKKEFRPTSSKRFRYCSTACRDEGVRNRVGDGRPPKPCPNCGRIFLPTGGSSSYCSSTCRKNMLKLQRKWRRYAFTKDEWESTLEYFGYKCAYCYAPSQRLTPDHVIPIIKDGDYGIKNIVPACLKCNIRKSRRDLIDFLFFIPARRRKKGISILIKDS
jgi:hypothetical protein